jgi:hypothetical protein
MNELVNQNEPKCTVVENRLSEKQQAAIELLLLGKSFTDTAKALDIARLTLYRWRQDELFRETLDDRRRELWSDAADRLKSLVHPSLDILERQMNDRYDRTQFRAAATVLRLAHLERAC